MMYETTRANRGLGFSLPRWLTPPAAVRNAFGQLVTAGENEVATQIQRAAAQLRVKTAATPTDVFGAAAEQVPGGMGTIAAVGIGLALLLVFAGRRSR